MCIYEILNRLLEPYDPRAAVNIKLSVDFLRCVGPEKVGVRGSSRWAENLPILDVLPSSQLGVFIKILTFLMFVGHAFITVQHALKHSNDFSSACPFPVRYYSSRSQFSSCLSCLSGSAFTTTVSDEDDCVQHVKNKKAMDHVEGTFVAVTKEMWCNSRLLRDENGTNRKFPVFPLIRRVN